MNNPECKYGVMAARQCPGLPWYVTIESFDLSAMSPPTTDPALTNLRCQRLKARIGFSNSYLGGCAHLHLMDVAALSASQGPVLKPSTRRINALNRWPRHPVGISKCAE